MVTLDRWSSDHIMHTIANENLDFHVRSSPVISTYGLAVVSRRRSGCEEYQCAFNVIVSIRARESSSNSFDLAIVAGPIFGCISHSSI